MATPTLAELRAAYERDESLTAAYAAEARAYITALEAEVARLREALLEQAVAVSYGPYGDQYLACGRCGGTQMTPADAIGDWHATTCELYAQEDPDARPA